MSYSSRREQRAHYLRFENLEDRRVLATIVVSTPADDVDGNTLNGIATLIASPGADNKISLREAVQAANNDQTATSHTIEFSTDPGDGLNGATITLTEGELSIFESVTIDASMLEGGITIDADQSSRIFNITDPTSGGDPPLVTLIGLERSGVCPASIGEYAIAAKIASS